jgi:hypothetical protein
MMWRDGYGYTDGGMMMWAGLFCVIAFVIASFIFSVIFWWVYKLMIKLYPASKLDEPHEARRPA